MPINAMDLPITEAMYTFVDNNRVPVHIAASTLYSALESARWPVTLCVMEQSLIDALKRGDLGVEEEHALTLPEEALERPGIIGAWGDAHICIDGAHRLWRRWKRGDIDFPSYYVPEALWREFTITGMPGTGEEWSNWNRNAKVRTPEMEAFIKSLGG